MTRSAPELLYFDTSALMPYYRPELLSDRSQAALLGAKEPVAISRLVEVEFASILGRLVRMRELDAASADALQTAFAHDITSGCYQVSGLNSAHYKQARDRLLLRKTPLRTPDALHLAVAHASDARLVIAYAMLASAARKHGVAVKFVTG